MRNFGAPLLASLLSLAFAACATHVDNPSETAKPETADGASGRSGGNLNHAPDATVPSKPVVEGGAGDAGHPGPCNPLRAHEAPVTFGTIVGIGKDSQGTLYLADEVPKPYANRVFVSAGDTLYRKRVTGYGSSGGPVNEDFILTYEAAPGATRALLIQRRANAVTAMALGPGDSRGFIGTPGATDEMLTVQGTSAIAGMKVRNLPGEVVLEYFADVEDGTVLVVTRPRDDATYEDFRVFYGTPDQMLERKLVNVFRGNDTDILFLVDSVQFDAHFSFTYEMTDAGGLYGQSGPATLETGGGKTLSVTERPRDAGLGDFTPGSLPGFSFICFR